MPGSEQTPVRKQSNEQRYYDALRLIAHGYDNPDRVARTAAQRYGLDGKEALVMAYDNIQTTAKEAIRNRRRPKS